MCVKTGRMMRMLALAALMLLLCSSALAQGVRGDLSARFASVSALEHEGKTYRLRPRLTSMLLLGVDRSAQDEAEFRDGGQADFLMLLAIDDNAKTVTPIEINRDTLTEITVLSLLGEETGTRRAQIALSYAFGDGGRTSGELACRAVSNLLLGTPVDEFAAVGMDGIAVLNDLIGGVEVTLEDDFTAYDASMVKGTTLTLAGKQAEYYLRQRYYVGDQSNVSRLARQRLYLQKAKAQLHDRIRSSQRFANTLFAELEPYMNTSMSRGKMINLANKVAEYEVAPILRLEGEARIGQQGYMEFEADMDDIRDMLISIFYE